MHDINTMRTYKFHPERVSKTLRQPKTRGFETSDHAGHPNFNHRQLIAAEITKKKRSRQPQLEEEENSVKRNNSNNPKGYH